MSDTDYIFLGLKSKIEIDNALRKIKKPLYMPSSETDDRNNPLINAARGRGASGINEDEIKKPTPTDQKIMIAGSFDTEKIQAIRELMEQEAIEFARWCGDNFKRLHTMWNSYYSTKYGDQNYSTLELYKLYQQ